MKSTPPRKGSIMNQNLSSYRIFYTVANTGNISKAAKELYISQPAISKSIQKLEESVGCRLFSRSSRGVVLTDEGQLLYEHVKTAFETLTLGEEKLKRSIELGVGHLKIGVSATLCKYMLLPYLKEFIRQNPHITISIHCQSTNDTLKLLEDDKIDIGLIGKPDNVKNIHFDYLEEIEDIFVATKDYLRNLHARGVRKDEILTSSTLMLLDQNNMTRQYIDDYLQENHIVVHDSIDISSMDLLIDFARIGVGVACVIKSFVQDDLASGALVEIPLGIPIHKREVGFAYRTNSKPSKSLNEFIQFYQNFLKENLRYLQINSGDFFFIAQLAILLILHLLHRKNPLYIFVFFQSSIFPILPVKKADLISFLTIHRVLQIPWFCQTDVINSAASFGIRYLSSNFPIIFMNLKNSCIHADHIYCKFLFQAFADTQTCNHH